jgi:imidazolonepropionase
MCIRDRSVLPGFVDSHAHLVFAGDRSAEFAARMAGRPYDGGGIASTVAATRAATADALRARLSALVAEMRAQGTTTVEIKSGYGLTVADEARALRLAREVTQETTFLGAHVVPAEFAGRVDEYVALVTGPMLAACAPHSRWVDVFCEPSSPHAFDGAAARAVLEAGRAAGLQLRVHANQLAEGPGVQLAVELGAASADHCTHLSDADVDALAGATPSPPCCRGPSSPPARRTRTRDGCSPPGSRWRWPPTATRAAPTRRPCPSASRSRCARCG